MMMAAERRWGLGQHGGKRKQSPSGWQKQGDAAAEPAVGGDNSADEVRKPDGKITGCAAFGCALAASGCALVWTWAIG